MIREQIMQALLTLVSQSAGFVVFDRRLQWLDDVASLPAVFVIEVGNQYQRRGGVFPPIREIEAEVWLYAATDPQQAPGSALNSLIDAVELALRPPTPGLPQTLGGLVAHCWIGGDDDQKTQLKIFEGHGGERAAAIIPVRVLVP